MLSLVAAEAKTKTNCCPEVTVKRFILFFCKSQVKVAKAALVSDSCALPLFTCPTVISFQPFLTSEGHRWRTVNFRFAAVVTSRAVPDEHLQQGY